MERKRNPSEQTDNDKPSQICSLLKDYSEIPLLSWILILLKSMATSSSSP
jgi:hypothetical protein